ncbi:hypothetical protein Tco_0325657, partial [Tanacetum coccineum]
MYRSSSLTKTGFTPSIESQSIVTSSSLNECPILPFSYTILLRSPSYTIFSFNTARPVNTVRSVNTGRPFSTARKHPKIEHNEMLIALENAKKEEDEKKKKKTSKFLTKEEIIKYDQEWWELCDL